MTTPAFWILIGGCIAVVGALIAAVGTFWNTNKQEKDKTQAAIQRANYEQESREKSDRIAELNEKIAADQRGLRIKADEQLQLQIELREKSDAIAELNRQLAAKSDEIASLNRSIAASITGGDSYCYMLFTIVGPNSAQLAVIHQGNYPLYDVSFRIVDLDIFERVLKANPVLTFDSTKSAEVVVPIGNLSPGQARALPHVISFDTDKPRYNIFISARNGMFTQLLRLRKVSGQWRFALQVTKSNYSEKSPNALPSIIKEQIQEGFPRMQNGQVDWEN